MELSSVHSELTNHSHACILFRVDNTLSYTLSVFPNLQTRNAGDLFHAKQTGSTSCLWTIILQMYSLTALGPSAWAALPPVTQLSPSLQPGLCTHVLFWRGSRKAWHLQQFPNHYLLQLPLLSFFFFFRTYRNWIPYISTSLFAYSPFVSLQCKPQEGMKLGWFTGRYTELCLWVEECCLLYQ